jgi:hypothetical protein
MPPISAAKAAADAGYLTADQLATITGQLSTLEGLQIDQVMKKYATASTAAADAAKAAADVVAAANTRVQDATTALTDAYNSQVTVLTASRDKFQGFVDRAVGRRYSAPSARICSHDVHGWASRRREPGATKPIPHHPQALAPLSPEGGVFSCVRGLSLQPLPPSSRSTSQYAEPIRERPGQIGLFQTRSDRRQ